MRPRLQLRTLSAAEATARLVERAKIIRLAHQGRSVAEISQRLKVSEMTVGRWSKRFNAGGLAGGLVNN